jgi:DnaJ-class molecular chaperone
VRIRAPKRTGSDANENEKTGRICVGFSISAQTMTTQSELKEWAATCAACGGCGMNPGIEPDDDIMNTPCPRCSPWAKNERAAAIAALEAIEARYTDGSDTFEDWKFMGDTARNFLADNT